MFLIVKLVPNGDSKIISTNQLELEKYVLVVYYTS